MIIREGGAGGALSMISMPNEGGVVCVRLGALIRSVACIVEFPFISACLLGGLSASRMDLPRLRALSVVDFYS